MRVFTEALCFFLHLTGKQGIAQVRPLRRRSCQWLDADPLDD